jgi:aspartokinase-like uncharacterized kinase
MDESGAVNLTVVKVGGSLYDRPDLERRLARWFAGFPSRHILFVPGGGPTAEVVRTLDRIHELGENAAHWIALKALSVNARFLACLIPGGVVIPDATHHFTGHAILDPYTFAGIDESRGGKLPASWDVTSDSIAARAAIVAVANRLVLLKSVEIPPGTDWSEAAARGWVDPYFPRLAAVAHFRIDAVRLPDL